MKKLLLLSFIGIIIHSTTRSQCSPQGNQVSYGTGDVWIGYVYDNINFTGYAGYVTEGTAGNPAFDQSFGGSNANYTTNGCSIYTSTYSVRYKLTKTFAAGGYEFTVGGDDGYRLSVDGGATWIIDRWVDQGYTVSTAAVYLDGTYDLVLEFYENEGDNRISFSMGTTCMGSENTAEYGTNDLWRGYVYDGTNFNIYKGVILRGSAGYASFDENFGGSNTILPTSNCSVQTETFSVRFRLRKNFPSGNYNFVVSGDDGYRLSVDGGATWIINRWNDQSFTSSAYSVNLNGLTDMVLEYYENGGDNRISFQMQSNIILKIDLLSFVANREQQQNVLKWEFSGESDPAKIEVERSNDGTQFSAIGVMDGADGTKLSNRLMYRFTDPDAADRQFFYRLRMTDTRGAVTYSPIVRVDGVFHTIRLFPTSVSSGAIYIQSPQRLQHPVVSITGADGRIWYRQELATLEKGQVTAIFSQTERLVPGMYFVRITTADLPAFQARFMKQ